MNKLLRGLLVVTFLSFLQLWSISSEAETVTVCDANGCHTVLIIRDSNGNIVMTNSYP